MNLDFTPEQWRYHEFRNSRMYCSITGRLCRGEEGDKRTDCTRCNVPIIDMIKRCV